jgi:hypothetical protein
MNITLHAASEELRALLDQVDPETGELPEGMSTARELVLTKAVATVAYLLESDKQADMVEDYAKELLQRVKAQRKRAEWLKRYLGEHMKATGIMSITDDRHIFSAKLAVARDKSVEIFDSEQLPAEYMRLVPASLEPDKRAIAEALQAEKDVPGARLLVKDRLTIK